MVARAFRQASGLTSDNRCYRSPLGLPVESALSSHQKRFLYANATIGHFVRGTRAIVCEGMMSGTALRCVDRALCPPLEGRPEEEALMPYRREALMPDFAEEPMRYFGEVLMPQSPKS